MSMKALPTDLPIHSFSTCQEFEDFLESPHKTSSGFYLKLAKKSSGIASVSFADSIEIGLCFGWINGQGNSLDNQWHLSRYTPRRSKSIWSQKNVDTVERLIKDGKMRPAGLAAVAAAKADGRWQRAYAGPATMKIPDDLEVALEANPAARCRFQALNKKDRYSVMFRIETGSIKTRPKRVEVAVQRLAVHEPENNIPQRKAKTRVGGTGQRRITKPKKTSRSTEADQLVKPMVGETAGHASRRAGLRSKR